MKLKCGIIGLPNVGKSTLFNILTKSHVKAENFPFCTINPNIGLAELIDPRLIKLHEITNSKKMIPSSIKFIDIAGLVKGSSKGLGIGNDFLLNIANTEVLLHVVRCFKDTNITHIFNEINPIRDIYTINLELILYDLKICEKLLSKNRNLLNYEKDLIKRCFSHLDKYKSLRTMLISDNEKNIINRFNFITIKPIIYITNISNYKFIKENQDLKKIKSLALQENAEFTYFMPYGDKELKYNLSKVIYLVFKLLNLIVFFTINNKEVRSWTIENGSCAIKAARKIHTDFEKGFIRAKIISFDDFLKYQSELEAKKYGKLKYEGKNYIIKDGDIVKFLFNK